MTPATVAGVARSGCISRTATPDEARSSPLSPYCVRDLLVAPPLLGVLRQHVGIGDDLDAVIAGRRDVERPRAVAMHRNRGLVLGGQALELLAGDLEREVVGMLLGDHERQARAARLEQSPG